MRKIVLVVLIIFSITVSFAFFQENKPKYENLKVLPKNISKQEMDTIMRHFSMSLGVRCNYCHVRETTGQKNFNFASDSIKNKIVARNMFKMMNKINKKYFKNEDAHDNGNMIPRVSCYSCHNGKEEPANRPPAPAKT